MFFNWIKGRLKPALGEAVAEFADELEQGGAAVGSLPDVFRQRFAPALPAPAGAAEDAPAEPDGDGAPGARKRGKAPAAA
jgi:hypothetical protein